MLKQILAVLCLYTAARALQQTPIPTYPGDDNPAHDGQPMFCQNDDTKAHAHNCECLAMRHDDPECVLPTEENQSRGSDGSKCKTYCRKTACRCRSHCDG